MGEVLPALSQKETISIRSKLKIFWPLVPVTTQDGSILILSLSSALSRGVMTNTNLKREQIDLFGRFGTLCLAIDNEEEEDANKEDQNKDGDKNKDGDAALQACVRALGLNTSERRVMALLRSLISSNIQNVHEEIDLNRKDYYQLRSYIVNIVTSISKKK